MAPFREKAFYLLVWRAILTALIAVVLMVTQSFQLVVAFLIGANVALLFSLGLMVWADQLNDERIVRTEAWRMLAPSQRPGGAVGRRWARNYVREAGLRFASAASVVSIALSASALVLGSE